MKKFFVTASIVLLIAIAIRLFGFGLEMAEDEQIWAISSVAPHGFQFSVIPHPPLAVFLYSIAGLFGNWRLLRSVPMLFFIGIFLITVLFARKRYGDEAAIVSGIILSISAWSILASVQIDMDGSIIALLGLASTFLFLEGLEKKSIKWLIAAGVVCGVGFLAKISFILFPLSFILYSMYLITIEKLPLKKLYKTAYVYISAAIVFGSYFIFTFIMGTNQLLLTESNASNYFTGFLSQNWINVVSILAQAIVLISPLLIGLFILSLLKRDKRDTMFLVIISVHAFFYLFVMTASYRPFERYWMPLIPFLAMLGGKTIVSYGIKKECKFVSFGVFAFVICAILLTKFANPSLYPLFPKDPYIFRMLTLDWNFLFPFHGASGPLGFFVPFWFIAFGFLAAAVILVVWLKKRTKAALVAFLILGVGYNVFISEEMLFSLSTPNVNSAARQVNTFIENENLSGTIFSYQATGYFKLKQQGKSPHLFFAVQYNNENIAKNLTKQPSAVVMVDFPSATKDSVMWKQLSSCTVVQKYEDKSYTHGYIFNCGSQS